MSTTKRSVYSNGNVLCVQPIACLLLRLKRLCESLLHALSLGLAIKPELGAHVLFVAVTIMTLCPTAEMNASASAAMLLDTEQSLVQPPLRLTHLLPKLVSLLSRKTSWPAQGGD
ncbi:unnamed protein product [Merluccius merluccius]